MKILKYPELWVLTVLATVTRFWGLFNPNQIVFDEVHFRGFTLGYLKGEYFFDVHPPLGKLIFAGFAKIQNINPNTADPEVVLRILPALAGVLIIPVFYLLLRQLRANRLFATLGALLLLFDNALLVESRYILMDSMLILATLASLLFWLMARNKSGKSAWILYGIGAILAGTAVSIKLTGLSALGVLSFVWLMDLLQKRKLKKSAIQFALLAVLPVIIFVGSFWLHFRLLPKSGPGDAFMTQSFQSTLIGNVNYNPKNSVSFSSKFYELNKAMFDAEESLQTATHPYSSKWYTWPMELRSIYYWVGDEDNGKQSHIYLLGNPAVWWGVIGLLLYAVITITKHGMWKKEIWQEHYWTLGILAIGFIANWLPFILIKRIMFLYHYLVALCFSIAFMVVIFGVIYGYKEKKKLNIKSVLRNKILIAVVVIVVTNFLFFAPISYGWQLSPNQLKHRMWLNTWR